MATELDAHIDLVAERLVVLEVGWRGVRSASACSRLPEYPGTIMDGDAHVRALTRCFASYATGAARADIAHATEVEDAGSAALYTDISREVDKRLGFLEAYLHHDGVSTEPARHDGSRSTARQDGRRAE